VFTARYALSPYIKQTRVVFKVLNPSAVLNTYTIVSYEPVVKASKTYPSVCISFTDFNEISVMLTLVRVKIYYTQTGTGNKSI
jgi:hypothetical protein